MEEYSTIIKDDVKNEVIQFVNFHLKRNNRLVLISSGGTTVPLEEKTVRYIDNFSIGTRGSSSAEQFLKNSYAVIFLYRKRSLAPYERLLNQQNILDSIKYVDEAHKYFCFNNEINMNDLYQSYNKIKENNQLLKIEYITVFDYLSLLEFTCKSIEVLKKDAMVYLAAAVSDFYIPRSELPKHKIQSNSSNGLVLNLKPVPKCLGKLKSEWCPNALIVSFKLETDLSLLEDKCKNSLAKYKHDIVIGNILEDRKNTVTVIQSNGKKETISLRDDVNEIEELIINFLLNEHNMFVEKN